MAFELATVNRMLWVALRMSVTAFADVVSPNDFDGWKVSVRSVPPSRPSLGFMYGYRLKSVMAKPSKPHSPRSTSVMSGFEPPVHVAPMRLNELMMPSAPTVVSSIVPSSSAMYRTSRETS